MNRALENSLLSKPNVKGILCADVNGLCIASKYVYLIVTTQLNFTLQLFVCERYLC